MTPTQTEETARIDAVATRILSVAKQAFLNYGYASVSMDRIAHDACVSKTTLYTRFTSKRELFLHVVSREGAKIERSFDPASAGGMAIEDALMQLAIAVIANLRKSDIWRIDQVARLEGDDVFRLSRPVIADLCDRLNRDIIYCLKTAPTLRTYPVADHESSARIFAALISGLYSLATLDVEHLNPADGAFDDTIRRAVRIFINGLGSGQPAEPAVASSALSGSTSPGAACPEPG